MNAITRPALSPAASAQSPHRARCAAPGQVSTLHITLIWRPAATREERIAIAALLLSGTGLAITPTTETAS